MPAAHHARLAELELEEWAAAHPSVRVVVLRPALLAGPEVRSAGLAALLAPRLPALRGSASTWQLAHVEDVAEAIALALQAPLSGVYNVAAEGWLSADEVGAELGRRPLSVAAPTAFAALTALQRGRDVAGRLLRRVARDRRSAAGAPTLPPGALAYLRHPLGCRLHATPGAGVDAVTVQPRHPARAVRRAPRHRRGRAVAGPAPHAGAERRRGGGQRRCAVGRRAPLAPPLTRRA